MTDIATLAEEAIRQPQRKEASPTIRKLFLLMHGAYGNQFASKFSTGVKDESGSDKGIRAAMLVWDAKLGKYPADVIEIAAGRVQGEHPDFPPNLPQFEKLCDAAMPRKTYAEENNLPRLPAPPPPEPVQVRITPCDDGKDWARRILARAEAGDKIRPYTLWSAEVALGKHGRMSWQ